MASASFFRLLRSAFGQTAEPRRRPARPRLFLESLEDRMVPSVSSSITPLGPVNNPNVTFNLGSTGQTVVSPSGQSAAVNPFGTAGIVPFGQEGQFGLLLGASAINTLSFGNPANRLFESSAVNTFGLGNQNLPQFTQTALGFGSGTQPGQPWVPNAYNLGLANQQSAFPTVGDHGFQAPAPWGRQSATQAENATPDLDEQPAPLYELGMDEEAMEDGADTVRQSAMPSVRRALMAPAKDNDQADPDADAALQGDRADRPTVELPQLVVQTVRRADGEAAAEETSFTVDAPAAAHPSLIGNEAAIDKLLLARPLRLLERATWEDGSFHVEAPDSDGHFQDLRGAPTESMDARPHKVESLPEAMGSPFTSERFSALLLALPMNSGEDFEDIAAAILPEEDDHPEPDNDDFV